MADVTLDTLTSRGSISATDLAPVQPAAGPPLLKSTAADFQNFVLNTLKQSGAIGNAITDDTTQIAASYAASATNPVFASPGVYLAGPVTASMTARAIVGTGWSTDVSSAVRPPTTFLKAANGTQLAMTGGNQSLSEAHFDGNAGAGKTGDGVLVSGSRSALSYVSSVNQSGDGFRLGGVGATGTLNANVWSAVRPVGRYNTGNGCTVSHYGGTVSPQFLAGAPDVNAGVMLGGDFGYNGGIGLSIDNTIDNLFLKPVAQRNAGKGIVLSANSKGNCLISPYSEANNGAILNPGDELDILPGAYANIVLGNRTPGLASNSGFRDQNAPGKNLMWTYETNPACFVQHGKVAVYNELSDATGADFEAYKGPLIVPVAAHRHTITGASGGRWGVSTKIDGGPLTERFWINATGDAAFVNQSGGTMFGGKTVADTTTTGIVIEANAGRIDVVNSGAGSKTCISFYDASGFAGTVNTNGSGTTTYATTSDYRKKTNLEPLSDALSRVSSLPAIRFNWIADPDGTKVDGFLAHEIQAVVPEAVVGEKDGEDFQAVDHSKLVPLLWAALQELAAKVALLEAA